MGDPHPSDHEVLGATVADGAARFVAASSVAERIELCLFGPDGTEVDRVDLERGDGGLWRTTVAGVGHGQRYGYRVHGPGHPAAGHACDPAKLLIDPAARRVTGSLDWTAELVAPGVDSSTFVPRSVVVGPLTPVPTASRPRTPWDETVGYEAHVGQLTARHPLVPAAHRGRYPGLAAPAVIDHLLRLGVTAVELLPVQHFVSEAALVASGRRNAWGYNPLAWSAPHAGYATPGGDPVSELRAAVAALHDAGIEVWLDVVFNHTCEGSLGVGPILSLRGFDNADAYRLVTGPHGLVDEDVTGCGNAVDVRSAVVRRLIRESLVGWVRDYGIDGFRFDLAATLIRGDHGPSADADLLAELAGDPALADVKLIAEPWDLGPGGYALGTFPPPWREWNDRFRDDVRDLWRNVGSWSTAADRLTGSADPFRRPGRDATASTNVVTTHDGFTLADLVTYDHPTDDGHGQRSWNGGLDGPTGDADVRAGRRRRQRAMLATVACAQGVPQVLSGDELGRSQGGRSNGYTLESQEWGLPWLDADWDLAAWLAAALAFRHQHPVLRRAEWLDAHDGRARWRTTSGHEMGHDQWADPDLPGLQVELDGTDLGDDVVALVLVTAARDVEVHLPAGTWEVGIDASQDRPPRHGRNPQVSDTVTVSGPGFLALVRRDLPPARPSGE